jgi:hypothetical protein
MISGDDAVVITDGLIDLLARRPHASAVRSRGDQVTAARATS